MIGFKKSNLRWDEMLSKVDHKECFVWFIWPSLCFPPKGEKSFSPWTVPDTFLLRSWFWEPLALESLRWQILFSVGGDQRHRFHFRYFENIKLEKWPTWIHIKVGHGVVAGTTSSAYASGPWLGLPDRLHNISSQVVVLCSKSILNLSSQPRSDPGGQPWL